MRLRSLTTSVAVSAALLLGAVPSFAATTPAAPSAAATLERVRAAAPADIAALAERALAARGVDTTHLDAVEVINPDDYQCGPTVLNDWAAENLAFTDEETEILELSGAALMPMVESILFGDAEGTQSYGTDGQYTKQITQAWKKLRTFWDEDSTEVELVPMHGRVLADVDRLAALYAALSIPAAEAREMAQAVAPFFDTDRFEHGDHPYFTFNAFATSGGDRGDQIIMGDGMMEFYGDVGLGGVAPQVILAHENVHQLQVDLGVYEDGMFEDPAESTRRTELQADAGAAYSVSHPRGLSMQWNRVRHVLPVFQAIGDCLFDNGGHHGTPNQRLAAGEFGYRMQEDARPRGHVLPGRVVLDRIDAHLPVLTAPDAR